MRVFTRSEIATWRTCQRKHHYAYTMLRRPLKPSYALTFGTLMHKALEAWWKSPTHEWSLEVTDIDPFDAAKVQALMNGYTAQWAEMDLPAVSVERQFECQFVDGDEILLTVAGKIDVVGEGCIIEHKTTSQDITEGSEYWAKLAIDDQISTYLDATGLRRCVYDVIKKPLQRPLKASAKRKDDETPEEYGTRLEAVIEEKPDAYYVRAEIVRTDDEIEEARKDRLATLAQMLRKPDPHIPRNPSACFQYGRCEYFGVCTKTADISDDSLFRTAATPHEELA